MRLDPGLALLHPVGRGHAPGELGEHLSEHALAAVAVDDTLVVDEVGRSLADRALRDARGHRLLFQFSEEAVERQAVMAGGGTGDRRGRRSGRGRHGLRGGRPNAPHHHHAQQRQQRRAENQSCRREKSHAVYR